MTGASDQAVAPDDAHVRVSFVAPCFDEADNIGEFYRRVTAAAAEAGEDSYEIVLVDDGSRDATWEAILGLAAGDGRVRGIRLSRNHGQQLALTAGLAAARGAEVLLLDADLQDPPELVGPMRQLMQAEGADVVYGRRDSRAGETPFKRATAALFYRLLASLTDTPIPVDTGDFRLISRRVVDIIVSMPERDRFNRGLVAWVGFKQVPFHYQREPRFAGEGKYPLRRSLRLASDAFLGFSMSPVRLAGILSLTFFVAMLVLIAYVLISWLSSSTVPGWTSLAIIVTLASAVQMFTLSVIGEYVGRIYMQGKARPLFIVAESCGGSTTGVHPASHSAEGAANPDPKSLG